MPRMILPVSFENKQLSEYGAVLCQYCKRYSSSVVAITPGLPGVTFNFNSCFICQECIADVKNNLTLRGFL